MAKPAFIYAFDTLGPDRFTELCGLLLGARYKGFLLGGIGPDGGVDAEVDDQLVPQFGVWHPETEEPLLDELVEPGQETIFQFKHKVTARVGQGDARDELLSLYKCPVTPGTAKKRCELHRKLVVEKCPAAYVLVTNVEVNAPFRAKFIEQCRRENQDIAHYQIIGLDELESWVTMDVELRHLWFPTIFGPPRFALHIELRSAFIGAAKQRLGFDPGILFCVSAQNVGKASSYVSMIRFRIFVDGKSQIVAPIDMGTNRESAYIREMNPQQGDPVVPGRSQSHYFRVDILRDALRDLGAQVVPVEVLVEDEVGNTYRAEIDSNLREIMMGSDTDA